jgi:antitoxin VapB
MTAGESWDEWFDNYKVTSDFMSDREQPEMQTREALWVGTEE